MKKIILLFFLFFVFANTKGQNLVPNGDFEQYSGCPNSIGQLDSILFGFNPTGASPDYFNQCSTSSLADVPGNLFGYQPAHSGNGYAGTYLFEMFNTTGGLNFREYIEIPLTSSLIAGNCYHFEMYVCLGELSNYVTSDFGVYFSTALYMNVATQYTLPLTPQITNSTGYISDTLNWTLISANYTASGGESYLIIGNFKDDAVIDTMHFSYYSGHSLSYIYIDDVSLTACTGTEEISPSAGATNDQFTIYPNPVKDELIIHSKNRIEEIRIYDVLGKEIYHHQNPTSDLRLPTSGFKSGIYFIEINNACLPHKQGKNVSGKKFMKF